MIIIIVTAVETSNLTSLLVLPLSRILPFPSFFLLPLLFLDVTLQYESGVLFMEVF
jgi:hypothetical protein